jgi:hypothetical protein
MKLVSAFLFANNFTNIPHAEFIALLAFFLFVAVSTKAV